MAALSLQYRGQAFSSCSKQGPTVYYSVRASRCGDFTGSRANGLSGCGALAHLLRSLWDLPRSGIESVSPALASGFLATGPPGKSMMSTYCAPTAYQPLG